MKLLLTGATGAAGLEVLRAAIADSSISQVTVLSRSPLPISFEATKAHVIRHDNFSSYPSDLISKVADHDACIWALGKSSSGMNEADYTRLTYDWPMAAIAALKEGGTGSAEKPFRFVYFSGEGADQTGKSMMMFARAKGRAERDLINFAKESSDGTMKAHIMRPGYFFPANADDRKRLRGGVARMFDKILTPMLTVVGPVLPIQDLGKMAVEIAKGTHGDEELFRNARMKELIKKKQKDEL